ncbi:anthranilate phosphoribosyltransferase [Sulfurovum sp. AR]|uniref:anthranilate phosphoribosyltransferase n=1 Tax=Sulfurovum sp. AR TaxID=1165841 RepID=UPI00025C4F9C|nr:anthranilate phosphoribosyltransferase [Sulfurovum sp. AR]EIF51203.1 anthranilate phosphoribosyltransferase [Sulfurovum sp. AR]
MGIREEFERLFNNEMGTEEARDFLVALYEKGESGSDIAAAASVMREHSIKLSLSDTLKEKAIDVVGTGGDKSGSFNISTTVSLLLASMGRVVAKHGNRSVTSNSGSTDVLEALGINLDLTIENKIKMLEETGFCFFPATDHHPAMKHIMPIRKSIEHRTIFNILGPLTNPAGAEKYLLGVFDPSFIKRIADALVELGAKRACVVSSHDGMDEISIASHSSFAYVESNRILEGEINPERFGFKLAPREAILGGDANFNAQITRDIFSGKEKGAKRDIVLLNAAFALFVDGHVRDIEEAIEMAKSGLDSGKASAHLERMAKISQQLSGSNA